MTWYERLLFHEYNECYLYYSMMEQESDPRIKTFWDNCLSMEIEHLKLAADLMRQYEKRDPEALLPKSMPQVMKFESNIDYVRNILKNQVDLTTNGTEFVPVKSLEKDHRYFLFQREVNSDHVPSEVVIDQAIDKFGIDYRQELAGPHPIEQYRQKAAVK
jgi:hypothetical protein